MKASCIIIEDEPLALEKTRAFVEKVPFIECLGEFDNALDALLYLKSNEVDIIFLDINMDELNGIQFLESISIPSEIIITSAYDEYALKSYELSVTDYLLKPFSFERFVQACNKAIDNISKLKEPLNKDYFFVKTEYRLEKIEINDILFIEGMGDYRRIHLNNKKIMTLQSFKEFEGIFPENKIARVHKSYMVAISKIDSISKDRILIGETRVPISDTYKEAFYKLIG